MKRILAVILSMLLCCCFVGCGEKKSDKDSASSKAKTNSSKSTTAKDEKYDDTVELSLNYDDYYQFEDAEKIDIKDKKIFKYAYATKTLHAVDITQTPSEVVITTSEGKKILYKISVAKSKINIVVVAGQSNAAGEITGIPESAKKYTQAVCDSSTTFMWNQNTTATPTAFKGGGLGANGQGTGICSSFARQWTEQMADAGRKEKVVLVFAKNYTATPGIKLSQYMDETSSNATVQKTVDILNKCYDYYEKGTGSKGYEIASCGMYWFQGEGDGKTSSNEYYDNFSTVWNKIKSGTNNRVKYCAIMRVRILDASLVVSNSVSAQYKLANDFDDIYMGSTLTELLTGGLDDTATLDVSNYKVVDEEQYSSIVSGNELTEKQGNIYGGLHYSQLGFNLLGADAAYNMIRSLNSPIDNATLIDAQGNRLANITLGSSADINASAIKGDALYAYMDVGSSGKAVKISVMSGSNDITNSVTTEHFTFNVAKIKAAGNARILVTLDGKTATFNIK